MKKQCERLLMATIYMYFIGLFGWAILRLVFPDRWWWLFLMDAFSLYAFVPLPIIAIASFFLKRRIILVPVGAAAVLGGLLYGELFLPQQSLVQADNQAQTIKVMTTNLLFSNQHTDAIVDALRRSDADVISLQELTTPVSEAIAQALRDSYPYQELHTEGFFGSGIISRYPMSEPPVTMPGNAWATRPYILRSLDVNGQQVLFLQFHATPTRMGKPSWMEQSLRIREQQAQELATLAQSYDGPFIAAGDFNATDMHYAYTLVTREMQDAWREVGWGAGQTFPSARTTDGRRASVWSIPIMPWLVRIDYVFYSGDAQATTANIGPWDGHSDHRPVVVDIQLP